MRHKADGRASASAVDTVVFAAAASAAAAVHWAGVFLRGAWYVFFQRLDEMYDPFWV